MSKIVTFNQLGRYGRAANSFFQIASTIGIARRNNFDFAFPLFINHHHRDAFGSTEDVELYKYFVNPLPLYEGPELPDYFVHWGYRDVVLKHSVSLSGHMQSERFFSHCLDEIRWYFEMVDEPPQNDYVAVHFRAGDYGSDYHPRMTMDYYGPAMAKFHGAKFLIFSDDLGAALEMFGDKVEYARGNYIEDFKLMKKCRHFIIGNSSYSAFAAILGEAKDKQVIAPRPWFGPAASISGESIYSNGWEVIDYKKAA